VSPETDRITVPTNGTHPPRHAQPEPDPTAAGQPPVPQPTGVFGPIQLVVGFGILAAIIALVAGSLRRRGRSGRRGPFGRG
jgi:hypothetical protein